MKSVFITGGTSGIGLSLAKTYLAEGLRVGVCGRDISKIEDLTSEKLFKYSADVLDKEVLSKAINNFAIDGLDIIIASAGLSVGSKTKLPDFEKGQYVIDVNVKGVLNTFAPAFDIFKNQGAGQFVAIASVAGLVGLPGASFYSASKAAIIKLCESFSLDLKDYNIKTTCVCPGFIDTPLTEKNDHSMPFIMSSDKASRLIYNAIKKEKRLYVFPWQMKSLMFILERLPRFLYRFIMGLKLINYSK